MMIIMDIMMVITWLVVWNMNGGLEFQHEKHITIVMLIIRITIITWLVVWNMNGL